MMYCFPSNDRATWAAAYAPGLYHAIASMAEVRWLRAVDVLDVPEPAYGIDHLTQFCLSSFRLLSRSPLHVRALSLSWHMQ